MSCSIVGTDGAGADDDNCSPLGEEESTRSARTGGFVTCNPSIGLSACALSNSSFCFSARCISLSGNLTFAQALRTETTFFVPHPSYTDGIRVGNGVTPASLNLASLLSASIAVSNAAEAAMVISLTLACCFSSP